ncbi:MAG: glycosyltransferase family 39 protein [Planctomycetes bacterium]|nr:glycosyltransferase family 39 protein [Planctomycetota bacterium]
MNATTPKPEASSALRPLAFWLSVAAIGALGLVLRLAILDEFLRKNPIAEQPWTDSQVYWEQAGRMAAGEWIQPTPFLSAPLYPYLLGLVRVGGGGLRTVYGLQLGMHVLTTALIALVAKRRCGTTAGVLACGLFAALTEPAVSSTRILGNTLQLFLVTLVWWRWVALDERQARRWIDIIAVGVLIGVLALSYPPAMLLVPLYGAWLWWAGGRHRVAAGRAAVGVACGVVAIMPATLHNLYVSAEFIPITAHAGITLRQGNGPKAEGVYTYVRGISPDRRIMHQDAARAFAEAHGREGTWREIDAHFRNEAFALWRSRPAFSAGLVVRKLLWFLTARHYDDIASATFERQFGIGQRALLAPLATPWLMGAALAGLLAGWRRPGRSVPEILLAALPLLVVLLFFYSPRYRLPAIPVLCGLAAWAIVNCRRSGQTRFLTVALIALPVPLYLLGWQMGFDNPDRLRHKYAAILATAQTRLGDVRLAAGDLPAAEQRYRAALQAYPDQVLAHQRLGLLHLKRGESREALSELRAALRLYSRDAPEHGPARAAIYRRMYTAYVQLAQPVEALFSLRRAVELQPNDDHARLALAWLLATNANDSVRDSDAALRYAEELQRRDAGPRADVLDVLASACAAAGRFDEAVLHAASAAEEARRTGATELATQIERRGALYRQRQPCRAEPRQLQDVDQP